MSSDRKCEIPNLKWTMSGIIVHWFIVKVTEQKTSGLREFDFYSNGNFIQMSQK